MSPTRHSGFLIESRTTPSLDFELVLPDPTGGLFHAWRNNDDPGIPWVAGASFAGRLPVEGTPSLIQSNFMEPGNLELVCRVGARLAHFWRHSRSLEWSAPTWFGEGCAGSPALLQGVFGARGNFEVVVPAVPAGIAHYWRNNDDPALPWVGPGVFGENLGRVDAVALVQGNYGHPGNLELVLRVGAKLFHFYRKGNAWLGGKEFFDRAAGQPAFLQGRHGGRGHFEVVTPLVGGGFAHLYRDNEEGQTWRLLAQVGAADGSFTALALIQSHYGTPALGNFEVAAWDGRRVLTYWRDDGRARAWHGPVSELGFVRGRHVPELWDVDLLLLRRMRERGLKAATLAVLRKGRVLFEHGYGWLAPPPDALLRIGEVSQALTRSAIGVLVRSGKLSRETKVFPLLGLLPAAGRKQDPRLERVTVGHLLDYRGGWDVGAAGAAADGGSGVRACDPAFASRTIGLELGLSAAPGAWDIARWLAGRQLDFEPGTREAYWSVGYLLLSLVIEKVSGQRFVDFLREQVLAPIGVKDVFLGRSLPGYRHERELPYLDPGLALSAFPPSSERRVPVPDGSWSIEATEGAAGLVASAGALVRYLDKYWLVGMEARDGDAREAVRAVGSLPGTHAEAVQRPGGVNWTLLFNCRVAPLGKSVDEIGPELDRELASIAQWPE
ncbi:MAG: beta-lactamase family protein [Planctomycetes bacterium]|nr:beta-lactamase family protein [Planctomycetota bacterium]